MSNKSKLQRAALEKTLDAAGLGSINVNRLKCLSFGEAVPDQNKLVHRRTNELLFELLLTGDFGTCIHVTGEMRALLDPFHREVCSEMHRRTGVHFLVLCDVPENQRHTSTDIIRWNLQRWSAKGTHKWEEQLRSFDVIAERAVDIRARNTLSEIQYSVFGHRYVLLQEMHPDVAPAKRIWLLESEELNQSLTERAQVFFDDASDIDERWYKKFLQSLGGVVSKLLLRRLAEGEVLDAEMVLNNRLFAQFENSPLDSVNALKAIGFIGEDAEAQLKITPKGREYLSLLHRA